MAESNSEEQGYLFNFLKALIAGIAAHIFAAHTFEFVEGFVHGSTNSPRQNVIVVLVSGAIAFLFTFWLRRSDEAHRPWPWLAVLGYLLLQWMAEATERVMSTAEGAGFESGLVVGGLGCGMALWILYRWARKSGQSWLRARQEVIVAPDPIILAAQQSPDASKRLVETQFVKADALILFLSHLRPVAERNRPPGAPRMTWPREVFDHPELLISQLGGMSFHDLGSMDMLKNCNWYMQVKGIQAHLWPYPGHNLPVVVIPSADEPWGGPGSWRQFGVFKELVERLAAPDKSRVQVINADESKEGIPFEDLEALNDAIRKAKEQLKARQPEALIVVDITGGKATCSAVGAALTLEHRERIQYVSTTDLSVKLYDLEYEAPYSPVD